MTDLLSPEGIHAVYAEKIRRYICSHVGTAHDREDLVQEVFLKIYSGLDRFDSARASLSTWIYTLTRNTVIDYYRKRRPTLPLPDALSEGLEDPAEEEALLRDLAEALATLDQRERDLIILHYDSGWTLKAIAEAMQLSYVYIKILHKKALTTLEERMKERILEP